MLLRCCFEAFAVFDALRHARHYAFYALQRAASIAAADTRAMPARDAYALFMRGTRVTRGARSAARARAAISLPPLPASLFF